MQFENAEEAGFRLDSTYVMFYDRFVRVMKIMHFSDSPVLHLQPVLQRGEDTVRRVSLPDMASDIPDGGIISGGDIFARLSDPGFLEFEPFPVGYVGTPEGIMYCQRVPTRSVYVGLTTSSLVFTSLQLIPPSPGAAHQTPMPWSSLLNMRWNYIAQAAERKAPEYINKEGGRLVLVIDHDFAAIPITKKTGLLLFEGVVVGEVEIVDHSLESVRLSSEWSFLTEACYVAGLPLLKAEGAQYAI